MRALRAADRVPVPWKNGGGVTREVAVHPPGAGMDDFGWRVSIADVVVAGPFSSFADVDRILTVLEGRLELRFEDGRTVELAPGQPFAFPGDVAVDGTPLGGPVRDLNVMVRRGAWRAEVSRWHPEISTNGTRIAIAADTLDAWILEPGETVLPGFDGYLIRLTAA